MWHCILLFNHAEQCSAHGDTQRQEGSAIPGQCDRCSHVYSDDEHIWLQLRRDVPTEQDIGRASFKIALCLQPGTAHKVGLELMNVAERNKDKQKAKNLSAKQAQAKAKQSGVPGPK